ncbi:Transposase [Phaeobacter gallaeciensis]|uniref:Transposase n=1 Tax=Phaeobacter gallaeciensis TaxID=60890 RepID=A0AAC9Z8V9_9RHOB|nr:hypothetical protein Gal_01601 [Phaeobacter gallaeciensis DSM 26640]ATE92625.1 Transposase [Phaeobacter gallaeciensis]ATE97553.1 Transposase [Phaeobacter gallaeciensis]ATF01290.1 Transposase [Phaeobacter gallaeciensis]ATF05670.1 Transposase [Phaeobacter gallaeciensis]
MSDLFCLTDAQITHLEPYVPKANRKLRGGDRRVLSGITFINRDALLGSDWEYVQQAEGLTAGCGTIRQMLISLPVNNRVCSPSYLLALKPNGAKAYSNAA